MRKPFGTQFMKAYDIAYNLYTKGQWLESKEAFNKVFEKRQNDPLSMNIIKFMS